MIQVQKKRGGGVKRCNKQKLEYGTEAFDQSSQYLTSFRVLCESAHRRRDLDHSNHLQGEMTNRMSNFGSQGVE